MINFSFGPNIFLACLTLLAAVILYGLRTIKPELARDEDIFFATLGLLYSTILIIHGWRLDPILLFSQTLIIISLIVTGWENIRLRGIIIKIIKNSKNK